MNEIVALEMGTFTFPDDEPWPGEEGVVIAYAIRHPGGIVLFDTGLGSGDPDLDARYHPVPRPLTDVLAEAGIALSDVTTVVNCHLHVDHAGQNAGVIGIPILVQPAEWEIAHTTDHTILDWIEGPGVRYEHIAGDHDVASGIQVIATPGHTPGHQSLVVETAQGRTLLVGQAVYSVSEWTGDPAGREGRSSARDQDAYDRSVATLRSLDPVRVLFAHDRLGWRA
jgi:glyoxylase-like metal-dependent hydrolase (beta-lactamase superfamily II)